MSKGANSMLIYILTYIADNKLYTYIMQYVMPIYPQYELCIMLVGDNQLS